MAERKGRVVGCYRLNPGDDWDRAVWTDPGRDAWYVSKLAIRRDEAGRGLGLRLLGDAEARARARGAGAVRLDCMADNPALVRYYLRAGYAARGEAEVKGFRLLRYEKGV